MIRKLRFPCEVPKEEEAVPISLRDPTPNEVGEYISQKQEQLMDVEKQVQYIECIVVGLAKKYCLLYNVAVILWRCCTS